MKNYLIEMWGTGVSETFFVKAKDYGEACTILAKEKGEASFKLLGLYEPMETNKKVMVRVG